MVKGWQMATICHKYKHHKFGDKGVPSIQKTIWYNQFCKAVKTPITRNFVTGAKEGGEPSTCRDVNTSGSCGCFEARLRSIFAGCYND